MPLTETIDRIVRVHHEPLPGWLAEVEAELRAAGPRDVQSQWRRLASLLEHHLLKEEVVVFPAAKLLEQAIDPGRDDLPRLLDDLTREHHEIDRLDAWLRPRLIALGAAGALGLRVLDDLQVHAGSEEADVLPEVRRLLDHT